MSCLAESEMKRTWLLLLLSITSESFRLFSQSNVRQNMEELPSRWEVELEFVQALSNLQYLNFLAQSKYLEDEKFLAYLKYLEYWREPRYAKFLVYPNCLHVLSLLQSEDFRQQILRADVAGVLMNDMVNRWKEPQHTFAATPLGEEKKEETNGGANGNGQVTEEKKESPPSTVV